MSQENVELAWNAPRAWNDGIDAFLVYLDADIEWHTSAESMEPGIYHGHDGVRDYDGRLDEILDERRIEPLEVIDVDDDHVILVVRLFGRGRNSGIEVNTIWAYLITVGTNGKAIRVEGFIEKAEALEAVGLRE